MNSTNAFNSQNGKVFNIAYKNNTVYIKHHVELNNTDLVNASSQFVGDLKFDDIKYIAWDFSDITNVNTDDYTAELLTSINKRYRQANSIIKTVFISNNIKLRNTINEHINLLNLRDSNTFLFHSINEFIVWSVSQTID